MTSPTTEQQRGNASGIPVSKTAPVAATSDHEPLGGQTHDILEAGMPSVPSQSNSVLSDSAESTPNESSSNLHCVAVESNAKVATLDKTFDLFTCPTFWESEEACELFKEDTRYMRMGVIEAMEARYGRATESEIRQFASTCPGTYALRPDLLVLNAAFERQWNIVLTLLEAGRYPGSVPVSVDDGPVHRVFTNKLIQDPVSFNSNTLLLTAGMHGTLVTIRYILNLREKLGITEAGMAYLPCVVFRTGDTNGGFYLLDTMPLPDCAFAVAIGRASGAVLYCGSLLESMHMLRDRIACKVGSATLIFADIVTLLEKHECESLSSDPDDVLMTQYPPVGIRDTYSLLDTVKHGDEADLGLLVQLAVHDENWAALQTLVRAGADPRTTAYSVFEAKFQHEDIDLLDDHKRSKGDEMAIYAANIGQFNVVRYLVKHGKQIGLTSAVNNWLPMYDAIYTTGKEAVWMLDNLEYESDAAWEEAVMELLSCVIHKGVIESTALILDRVRRRLGSDSEKVGRFALHTVSCAIDDERMLYLLLNETWIQACEIPVSEVYSLMIDEDDLDTESMSIFNAAFKRSVMARLGKKHPDLESAIRAEDATEVGQAIVHLYQCTDDVNLTIIAALHLSMECGSVAVFTAVVEAARFDNDCNAAFIPILLFITMQGQSMSFLRAFAPYIPQGNDLVSTVTVLTCMALSDGRVADVLPVLEVITNESNMDAIFTAFIKLLMKYSDIDESYHSVMHAAAVHINDAQLELFSEKAVEQSNNAYWYSSWAPILEAARDNPQLYDSIVCHLIVGAASNGWKRTVVELTVMCDWRSDEERREVLTKAAAVACEEDHASTLNAIMDLLGTIPAEVRLGWVVPRGMECLVYDGISWRDLVAAHNRAAVDYEGNIGLYESLNEFLSDMCQCTEVWAVVSRNDESISLYRADNNREQLGIKRKQMPIVSAVVAPDASSEDICVICYSELFAIEIQTQKLVSDADSAHELLSSERISIVVQLLCPGKHRMHYGCVYQWFGNSRVCPVCNHDFSSLLDC